MSFARVQADLNRLGGCTELSRIKGLDGLGQGKCTAGLGSAECRAWLENGTGAGWASQVDLQAELGLAYAGGWAGLETVLGCGLS